MTTYEELQLITSVALLAAAILTYVHKKEFRLRNSCAGARLLQQPNFFGAECASPGGLIPWGIAQ